MNDLEIMCADYIKYFLKCEYKIKIHEVYNEINSIGKITVSYNQDTGYVDEQYQDNIKISILDLMVFVYNKKKTNK